MVEEINSNYKYPIIVITASVVGAILLGFFVGRPMWNAMQKTRAELRQKKDYLEKLEDKLASLKILKEREEEIKQKNAKVLAALPTDKDLPRLFYQFEQAATEAGVMIDQTTESSGLAGASDTASTNLFQQVTYQVTTKPKNYQALKDALIKYESALRLLAINRVETSLQTDELATTFELITFKRSEQ